MTLIQMKVLNLLHFLDDYARDGVNDLPENHPLFIAIEDLKYFPLGRDLPPEGRELWLELRLCAPRERQQFAFQLHEWFERTYLTTPRLRIDLDSETLILDGVIYSGIERLALYVIRILYEAMRNAKCREDDIILPKKQIMQKIPGCRSEKNIQRAVKRLANVEGLPQLVIPASGQGYYLRLPPSPGEVP